MVGIVTFTIDYVHSLDTFFLKSSQGTIKRIKSFSNGKKKSVNFVQDETRLSYWRLRTHGGGSESLL